MEFEINKSEKTIKIIHDEENLWREARICKDYMIQQELKLCHMPMKKAQWYDKLFLQP